MSQPIRVFYDELAHRFYATNKWRIEISATSKPHVVVTGETFDVTDAIGTAIREFGIVFSPVRSKRRTTKRVARKQNRGIAQQKPKSGPIHHVGTPFALCNKLLIAHLRDDLGSKRYRQLGVKERFRDEAPYRICERCIRSLERQEIATYGRFV